MNSLLLKQTCSESKSVNLKEKKSGDGGYPPIPHLKGRGGNGSKDGKIVPPTMGYTVKSATPLSRRQDRIPVWKYTTVIMNEMGHWIFTCIRPNTYVETLL